MPPSSACSLRCCPSSPPHKLRLRGRPRRTHRTILTISGTDSTTPSTPIAGIMERNRPRAGPRTSFPILARRLSICISGATPGASAMPPTSKRELVLPGLAFQCRTVLPYDQHPLLLGEGHHGRVIRQFQRVVRLLALAHRLAQNLEPRCGERHLDRKSTRLNSSHLGISYAG